MFMKRSLIILFLLFTSTALFSQNSGTISIKKPAEASTDTTSNDFISESTGSLGIEFGYQYFTYGFIDISPSWKITSEKQIYKIRNGKTRKKITRCFGTDFKLRSNEHTWGMGIRGERIFPINKNIGFFYSDSFVLYRSYRKQDLINNPKVGFIFLNHINISYGYNLNLDKKSRQEISTINTHEFTISYCGYF